MQERNRLETWWGELDEFTRRRVRRLRPADLLPDDLVEGLQRNGIRVTQLRSSSTGEPVWAQPEVLLEFLTGEGPD